MLCGLHRRERITFHIPLGKDCQTFSINVTIANNLRFAEQSLLQLPNSIVIT